MQLAQFNKSCYLFFASLMLMISGGCDKNLSTNIVNEADEHDLKVYRQAIKFNDVGTAIHAIHSLLARDTGNVSYYDSLSVLYYRSQNYAQAIQAAQYVLEEDTSNLRLIELSGRAYQALGRVDLAIPFYRHLVLQTKNPEYSYQIAVSHFFMQQFNEAEAAIKHVIENPLSDSLNVLITSKDRQQQVPLTAAGHNLLGSILIQKKMKKEAKQHYEKALEIYPEFILPKENLQKIAKLK